MSFWAKGSRLLKLDQAIVFSVGNQAQNAIFLLLTLGVISLRLTSEEQGYYYTFSSIVGLQVLIELGLLQCILQFASHESAHLSIDDRGLSGPQEHLQRLGSLLRFSLRWYSVAAVAVLILLIVAGWLLLDKPQYAAVEWRMPWLALAVITAGMVVVDPLWALLEGCNQVAVVARVRFWFNLAKNITLVTILLAGGGLYAVSLSAAIYWLAGGVWLYCYRRVFFIQLWRAGKSGAAISWRSEIWPYQWRIGVSWLSGYFLFTALNPIIFTLVGAVAAGQFGMTWTLLQGAGSFGRIWMRTKSPQMGQLIAKRQRTLLDEVWVSTCWRSVGLTTGVSAILVAGILFLPWLFPQLAVRVLGFWLAVVLAVGNILNEYVICMAMYLRAHKTDPYVWLSLGGAIATCLVVPAATYKFGVAGTVSGFLIVTLVALPFARLIFNRFREDYAKSA